MTPFLKWAGGKRWLSRSESLPEVGQFERYFEPFLGGGAMFFRLRPHGGVIADINEDLINLYTMLRDFPAELRDVLEWHQSMHSKDHFYNIRSAQFTNDIARAARMWYLNRTCWNGLYRVNRRGEFNVPIGTKNKVLSEEDDIPAISDALRSISIKCQDFEITLADARQGDLVFIDPPYTANHNSNGFLKYNEHIFGWADQLRLLAAATDAARRGAKIIVTNADHESVRELYCNFSYAKIHRSSVLAGKRDKRGPTTEAMFTANF